MGMIREEFRRLVSFEQRHRRLLSRLVFVLAATVIVDVLGTALMFVFERDSGGTEIRSIGQAFFFTTVQLLTVSSQIKNPVTPLGRIVDVVLEIWAVIVVAGSAGAIAAFFQSGDSE